MEEPDNFFSPDQEKLLSIAVWAKNLAWVALLFGFIYAGISTLGIYQSQFLIMQQLSVGRGTANEFLSLLTANPSLIFQLSLEFAFGILRAVIYYLVLKGISLGLNMIVETDINYRESNGGRK